ncbi:ABC transporter ATP-binding protein [bacterium]|nr:ABC transporter ATP-binding protein [bacterium]
MSESALTANAVEKDYPSGDKGLLHVLRGVDLRLERGDSVSIVGRSGAGKSTLLHILGALEDPSRGEVEIDGKVVGQLDDRARSRLRSRRLGFIFQFHYLLSEFSALENVMVPLRIAGVAASKARRTAAAALEEMGLGERLEHRPAQLSGGEQQRVAVARALVHEPDFVLADEPTGNLDRENGALVSELLFGQIRKRGMGLVLVTHDQGLAGMTGRSLLLDEGRLLPVA